VIVGLVAVGWLAACAGPAPEDGAPPAGDPDRDGDGFTDGDCAPDDGTVHPGASELCDGLDNDCDEAVDEELPSEWWVDADGDGHGAGAQVSTCAPEPGLVAVGDDCDDDDATVHPDAAESPCNGIDDNCDGAADAGAMEWFPDRDQDGWGAPAPSVYDCAAPPGHVADGTDCDDGDPLVNPGADEGCDGDDDNCDGRADLGYSARWYTDEDGDGHGHPAQYSDTCDPDPGWVLTGDDCRPNDGEAYPGAPERCNGDDDSCDGVVDEDMDADGDGHRTDACADGTDCDDAQADVHPGAVERCDDAVDQDCDGEDRPCGVVGGYDVGEPNVIHGWCPEPSYDTARLVEVGDFDGDGVGEALMATLGARGYGGAGWVFEGIPTADASLDSIGYHLAGDHVLTFGAGRSIGIGDVDGDGLDDAGFGAPYADHDGQYIVLGPLEDASLTAPDVALWGLPGIYAGHGSDLGDVNGDGIADSVIGAYNDSRNGSSAGTVFITFGPLEVAEVEIEDEADALLLGELPGNLTGRAMRAGSDVNGDGVGDILAPAPYSNAGAPAGGAVYVVYGPPVGVLDLADADGRLLGEGTADTAGATLWFGDVNGDALQDVIVGGEGSSAEAPGAGSAYVVFGPAAGDIDLGAADVRIRGAVANQHAGSAVSAGDVDGDGIAEVLVGASGTDRDAGAAYLFVGPLAGDYTTTDAEASFTGADPNAYAGAGVAIGDLDGDGLGEVLVGAPGDGTGGASAGAVYIPTAYR
jgi:hypothetical protein